MRTPDMTTCLWFTGQAEEAAAFYLSIFKAGKTLGTSYYGEDAAQQNSYAPGSVLAIWFEIIGRRFIAMNVSHISEEASVVFLGLLRAAVEAVQEIFEPGLERGSSWVRYTRSWTSGQSVGAEWESTASSSSWC